MIYLFIGFLAPAILFLILGLFACLRKTTRFDDKDYQSIHSNDENNVRIRMPSPAVSDASSYQMIYENPHFIEYKRPPSYQEALRQKSCNSSSRHLPPNRPKILEQPVTPQQSYIVY
ncbi:unnamed protein product [Caenorhabditis angaria]|uniref:Uncharacterized protein n=1 Tax=Caenorhabditis angaria TaxID=860376 RepID=A0A9P1J1B8_9PELO|nr:unnamed protein product [Caenorhabditis angaria]